MYLEINVKLTKKIFEHGIIIPLELKALQFKTLNSELIT